MFWSWIAAKVRQACWQGVSEFAAEFDAAISGTDGVDALPPALRQRLQALPAPQTEDAEAEATPGRKRKTS